MSDVARAAGVSTASASRALTRPGLVSDALRERVRYAATTLGYVANPAARSLSTQRSGMVGIVVGRFADSIGAAAWEAAEARLATRGLGALVAVAGGGRRVEDCARSHAAHNVDGVMFIGVDPPGEGWIARRALPTVGLGASGPIAPTLSPEAGGRVRGRSLIEAYLAGCGHLRIGVIDGPAKAMEPVSGAAVPNEPAIATRQVEHIHDVTAIGVAVRELLDQGTTALCLPDDLAAAAALKACRAIGLAVPGAVSIVGWGDTALARCLTPTLSSVRFPIIEMAAAAVDYLLATIAGEDYAWQEFPLKLVIRESSGSARP